MYFSMWPLSLREVTPVTKQSPSTASSPSPPSELREKIKAELVVTTWQWLKPHAEREGLLWVQGADLTDVALAVALDDAQAVQDFLSSGALIKAQEEPLEGVAGYSVAIVQPFVLATPLPEPPPPSP